MANHPPVVLAVDPGRDKCGLAVLRGREVLFRALVPAAETGLTCWYLLGRHPEAICVIGDSTGSAVIRSELIRFCPQLTLQIVSEAHSTLQARQLYFTEHSGGFWNRLLPVGLRVPPRPVDDYAAVILAERYLSGLGGT